MRNIFLFILIFFLFGKYFPLFGQEFGINFGTSICKSLAFNKSEDWYVKNNPNPKVVSLFLNHYFTQNTYCHFSLGYGYDKIDTKKIIDNLPLDYTVDENNINANVFPIQFETNYQKKILKFERFKMFGGISLGYYYYKVKSLHHIKTRRIEINHDFNRKVNLFAQYFNFGISINLSKKTKFYLELNKIGFYNNKCKTKKICYYPYRDSIIYDPKIIFTETLNIDNGIRDFSFTFNFAYNI